MLSSIKKYSILLCTRLRQQVDEFLQEAAKVQLKFNKISSNQSQLKL